MMTNFRTDRGDVEEPGRVVGQVFNDIYFERNQMSPWYGEPRPSGTSRSASADTGRT